RAHERAVGGFLGQNRRLGMALFEVFDDRERLRQHAAVVFERRQQRLGVFRDVGGGQVLAAAAPPTNRPRLGSAALQIERDAHAIGRRAVKKSIELHHVGLIKDERRAAVKQEKSAEICYTTAGYERPGSHR